MKRGARDYIRKEELERLVPTVAEVMQEVETNRQRQEALHSILISEARYRRLFETAQDGIMLLDALTGQVTDVNPYLTKMLGYPRTDFIGKKLCEMSSFKGSDASKSTFLDLQNCGYVRYEDLPLQARGERRIDVEFVSNLYDVGQQKVIQCNVRNITRRKEAETTVHQLNLELAQRVKDRTAQAQVLQTETEALNYSVTHDLKAPLRRIAGFAKALDEDCGSTLNEEGRKFIASIRTSSELMSGLLDGLTEVARISRSEVRREPVDLSELVRSIASELHQITPDRQIEFVVAAGIVADCDPNLINRALSNLLANACKFTSRRGAAQIEFGTAAQRDGALAYFVRDNGVGFDMLFAERLFGVFQRLHTAVEFSGTGVGLACVERIIRLHGGRVWAEAVEDVGATFYFTL